MDDRDSSPEHISANAHPPKREDFGPDIQAPLRPEHFTWGPAPIPQRNNDKPIMACLPSLPDPYDDGPIHIMPCELEARGTRAPKKPRKRRSKKQASRRARVQTKSPTRSPPPPPPPCYLMMAPLEVREHIYRCLLVAETRIPVHRGWQRVFARKRPCLETAILRVSRQINLEATRVLYAENQFLSRVTLPPNRVVDIEALAHIDEPDGEVDREDDEMVDYYDSEVDDDDDDDDGYVGSVGDGDDDSDGDFEPIAAELRQAEKSDAIDVEKYGCLFRQLVVEVGCGLPEATRERMVGEELDVFTTHPAVWAEPTLEENDGNTLGFVLRYNY